MRATGHLAAAAALASLHAGCSNLPGTTAALEREARVKLEGLLLDAESARFRDVRAVVGKGPNKERGICGEVNAKNRMGAYSGFTRFVVSRDDAFAVVDPQHDLRAEPRTDQDVQQAGMQGGFDAVWQADCAHS